MRFLIFFIGSFFIISAGLAQDSIALKMDWLIKAKSRTNLFVHFDKNVYSNNEIVYFTGYLLKLDSLAASKHRVMAVALIREIDSTVVLQDKFYMNNGLSFGNLTILDKVIPGSYYFIAYTDRLKNGMPEALFTQPITIKTAKDPPFNANIKLLDTAKTATQKKILINVTSSEGRFITNPAAIIYKYANKTIKSKTDKYGQLIVSLPTIYNLNNPNIYVKIKHERDSNFISMAIPQPKGTASVNFYPEGGNLVTGVPTIVGWEVKDQQKLPMALKAFLYKNDEIIRTLETSSYGIGKFKLIPEIGAIYKVKLVHSSLVDTSYLLPKAQSSGVVINISKAVATDTLKIMVSSNESRKITLRVHDFQNSFLTMPFNLNGKPQIFKIPLNDVPKGLGTITITDSLDRPLAERMFFAHYNPQKQISIETDKLVYNQREKITLRINLANPKYQALVSAACVQNSRLEAKNMQDINNYSYLTHELNQLPQNINGNALADENYLEQVLLVKGWRRYNWQDLQMSAEKLGLTQTDSLKFSGNLSYPKKGVIIKNIITYGSPKPLVIPVDSAGNFYVDSDQMVEKPFTKLYFLLNNPDRAKVNYEYQIKLNDPYLLMNAKLAKQINSEAPIIPSALPNNATLVLKNNERVIQLKEVKIGSKKDGFIGNACGDYVCPYNILNCVNHVNFSGNSLPSIGYRYIAYSGRPETVIYKGCEEPNESVFFKARPVYLSKEYYINDYKDPQEPAFFSTIYWNYGLVLNGTKQTEISFFTSDIIGKFRVVIQGVSNNDVIYGEQFFEVKPTPLTDNSLKK